MSHLPADAVFWRSLLFVPADNQRFLEKARGSTADAVILDLEDSVLAEHKEDARVGISHAAAALRVEGRDVLVRINRPPSLAIRDLERAVGRDVCAIVVPKVSSAAHLFLLTEVIEELEAISGLPNGHTKLVPLIETADAVGKLNQIAPCPRVVAIAYGDEDLAADMACEPGSDTITALKSQLIVAASRAGIRPLGLIGSISEYRDLAAYESFVTRSASAGIKGTLCVHPAQVDIANAGFAPTQAQIDEARAIVEVAEAATLAGLGAVGLGGKMIDPPIVRRAQMILLARDRYARRTGLADN